MFGENIENKGSLIKWICYENYREIYLKVSHDTLYRRDQKKLYSTKAKNVVGVDLPWDEPGHSSIVIQNDGQESPEEIVDRLMNFFGLE